MYTVHIPVYNQDSMYIIHTSPGSLQYSKERGEREYTLIMFNFFCIVQIVQHYPLFKVGNARFTTVPLKTCSHQLWVRYACFCLFKLCFLICGFFVKVTCAFLVQMKQMGKGTEFLAQTLNF